MALPRLTRIVIVLLVEAAVVLRSGCSKTKTGANGVAASTPADSSSAPLPAPCSLITQAEAETAMGKGTIMTKARNPYTGREECHLKGTTPGLDEIDISVHHPDMWDQTKATVLNDSRVR